MYSPSMSYPVNTDPSLTLRFVSLKITGKSPYAILSPDLILSYNLPAFVHSVLPPGN